MVADTWSLCAQHPFLPFQVIAPQLSFQIPLLFYSQTATVYGSWEKTWNSWFRFKSSCQSIGVFLGHFPEPISLSPFPKGNTKKAKGPLCPQWNAADTQPFTRTVACPPCVLKQDTISLPQGYLLYKHQWKHSPKQSHSRPTLTRYAETQDTQGHIQVIFYFSLPMKYT